MESSENSVGVVFISPPPVYHHANKEAKKLATTSEREEVVVEEVEEEDQRPMLHFHQEHHHHSSCCTSPVLVNDSRERSMSRTTDETTGKGGQETAVENVPPRRRCHSSWNVSPEEDHNGKGVTPFPPIIGEEHTSRVEGEALPLSSSPSTAVESSLVEGAPRPLIISMNATERAGHRPRGGNSGRVQGVPASECIPHGTLPGHFYPTDVSSTLCLGLTSSGFTMEAHTTDNDPFTVPFSTSRDRGEWCRPYPVYGRPWEELQVMTCAEVREVMEVAYEKKTSHEMFFEKVVEQRKAEQENEEEEDTAHHASSSTRGTPCNSGNDTTNASTTPCERWERLINISQVYRQRYAAASETARRRSPGPAASNDMNETKEEEERRWPSRGGRSSSSTPLTCHTNATPSATDLLQTYCDGDILLPISLLVPTASRSLAAPPLSVLRPHQVRGIRFLWQLLGEGPVGQVPGVGAILAHAMGLGKTAQVIVFLHLFFQSFSPQCKGHRYSSWKHFSSRCGMESHACGRGIGEGRNKYKERSQEEDKEDGAGRGIPVEDDDDLNGRSGTDHMPSSTVPSCDPRVMVIAPKTVISSWEEEFKKWRRHFHPCHRLFPIQLHSFPIFDTSSSSGDGNPRSSRRHSSMRGFGDEDMETHRKGPPPHHSHRRPYANEEDHPEKSRGLSWWGRSSPTTPCTSTRKKETLWSPTTGDQPASPFSSFSSPHARKERYYRVYRYWREQGGVFLIHYEGLLQLMRIVKEKEEKKKGEKERKTANSKKEEEGEEKAFNLWEAFQLPPPSSPSKRRRQSSSECSFSSSSSSSFSASSMDNEAEDRGHPPCSPRRSTCPISPSPDVFPFSSSLPPIGCFSPSSTSPNFCPTLAREFEECTELVVCDEAHRLKKENLQCTDAILSLRPLRRLLLTGTPLQNHLMEYWTMLQCAVPQYYSRQRFRSYFMDPIEASTQKDATKTMLDDAKKRTYTLIRDISAFMQRVDRTPLLKELPPIQELVVTIPLSAPQRRMYIRFIRSILHEAGAWDMKLNFLSAAAFSLKITAHPHLVYHQYDLLGSSKTERKGRGKPVGSDTRKEKEHTRRPFSTAASPAATEKTADEDDVMIMEDDAFDDEEVDSLCPPSAALLWSPSLYRHRASSTSGAGTTRFQSIGEAPLGYWREEGRSLCPPSDRLSSVMKVLPLPSSPFLSFSLSDPCFTTSSAASIFNSFPQVQNRVEDILFGSQKLLVAVTLIMKAIAVKEKVLVFSMSTQLLDFFEALLAEVNEAMKWWWSWSSQGGAPFHLQEKREQGKEEVVVEKHFPRKGTTHGRQKQDGTTPPLPTLPEMASSSSSAKLWHFLHSILSESSSSSSFLPISFVRLDGSCSEAARRSALRRFDSDPHCHVFLLSSKAGGVGVTITAATRVILLDSGFNPADEHQAIGRAYRYGQKKPVFVYRLMAEHTLESLLFTQKLAKEWLFKTVVEVSSIRRSSHMAVHLRQLYAHLHKMEMVLLQQERKQEEEERRKKRQRKREASAGQKPPGKRRLPLSGEHSSSLRSVFAEGEAEETEEVAIMETFSFKEDHRYIPATTRTASSSFSSCTGISTELVNADPLLISIAPLIASVVPYGSYLEKDDTSVYGEAEQKYYEQYCREKHSSTWDEVERWNASPTTPQSSPTSIAATTATVVEHQGRTLMDLIEQLISERSTTSSFLVGRNVEDNGSVSRMEAVAGAPPPPLTSSSSSPDNKLRNSSGAPREEPPPSTGATGSQHASFEPYFQQLMRAMQVPVFPSPASTVYSPSTASSSPSSLISSPVHVPSPLSSYSPALRDLDDVGRRRNREEDHNAPSSASMSSPPKKKKVILLLDDDEEAEIITEEKGGEVILVDEQE